MPKMKGLEVATGDIKAKGQRDRIMPMISTVTDSLRGMCSGDRQVWYNISLLKREEVGLVCPQLAEEETEITTW